MLHRRGPGDFEGADRIDHLDLARFRARGVETGRFSAFLTLLGLVDLAGTTLVRLDHPSGTSFSHERHEQRHKGHLL